MKKLHLRNDSNLGLNRIISFNQSKNCVHRSENANIDI